MNEYEKLAEKLIKASSVSKRLRGDSKIAYAMSCSKALFGKFSFPTIVVAGTKGKGSTCAVIESALRSSGMRTGLFTSPHLETPRERIKINGKCVSPEEYVHSYEVVKSGLESNHIEMPPFFGLHTLMSANIFNDEKVDVAVIECGIGGRFDWTKIYSPLTTVVTHLEYDHTNVLGKTADMIAWHKAGILSDKAEGFTSPQKPLFMGPLMKYAKEQGCDLHVVRPVWKGMMGLKGPTAEENTALGIAAAKSIAKQLHRTIKAEEGAANSEIFGRYQIYQHDGIKWMLDGAHTKESIESCCKWYFGLNRNSSDDVLISSVTKGRNINMLMPLLARTYRKKIFISKSSEQGKKLGFVHAENVNEALKMAKSLNPKGVVVTGSLRLVGDSLKLLKFPIK